MTVATARRRSGFTHDVEVDGHRLVIDEPDWLGGNDEGPSPSRVLAASLAACTAITVEMYAERKGWDVGALEVRAKHEPDERGTIGSFLVTLRLPAGLDEDQIDRIRTIAHKCPIHRVLTSGGGVKIEDRVEVINSGTDAPRRGESKRPS